MEKLRVSILGYERHRLDLYGGILEDEGYNVHLFYPNVENIEQMGTLIPDFILVDVTEKQCEVGHFLFQWLRAHAHIPVLFCMDKYLEALSVLAYTSEYPASLYTTPFNIDDFIETTHQTLMTRQVCS